MKSFPCRRLGNTLLQRKKINIFSMIIFIHFVYEIFHVVFVCFKCWKCNSYELDAVYLLKKKVEDLKNETIYPLYHKGSKVRTSFTFWKNRQKWFLLYKNSFIQKFRLGKLWVQKYFSFRTYKCSKNEFKIFKLVTFRKKMKNIISLKSW